MGLGIVKTSWTTVILPPYSSSIILGYLIYRKTFTHSPKIDSCKKICKLVITKVEEPPTKEIISRDKTTGEVL